jgi:hypothetical protein
VSRDKHGSQNPRRLPALRLEVRENPVKAPLAPGTSGALPALR